MYPKLSLTFNGGADPGIRELVSIAFRLVIECPGNVPYVP